MAIFILAGVTSDLSCGFNITPSFIASDTDFTGVTAAVFAGFLLTFSTPRLVPPRGGGGGGGGGVTAGGGVIVGGVTGGGVNKPVPPIFGSGAEGGGGIAPAKVGSGNGGDDPTPGVDTIGGIFDFLVLTPDFPEVE